MRTYQINEIFDSIQGEGYWTGRMCTFIRLQGCTVGCPWCDSGPLADATWGRQTNGLTRNTWGKGGVRMTVDEIMLQVHYKHVVITGGEPTMYPLDDLLLPLHRYYVQIETSGQNALKGDLSPNWITWSPKKSLEYKAPKEIMIMASEIKFVVDDVLTFEDVLHTTDAWYEATLRDARHGHKYLMPEGCPPKPENVRKTMTWLESLDGAFPGEPFRFGDRLQYRLGIR